MSSVTTATLTNPSDAITFLQDDRMAAAVAVMILGEGFYGLEDDQGGSIFPIFLLGGTGGWIKENIGEPLEDFIKRKAWDIARFLRTGLYGTPQDRVLFEEETKEMSDNQIIQFRNSWNDKKRSSLTNILLRAE